MSGNLIFARDSATNTLYPVSCDSNGDIDVNIASLDPAHGLATEAKQDTMITDLTQIVSNTERLAPQLSRTEAIPVQIMVGSGGANYDALRANGQDLMVMIDDMNPDVAVNSGLSTAVLQTAGNTILTDGTQVVKCMGNNGGTNVQLKVDADGVLETSGGGGGGGGDATAANQVLEIAELTLIAQDTSSLDSKIIQGNDAQIPNTELGLQQVVCYGRDNAGNLDALKTTSNGNLECEISGPLGSNLTMDSVSVVVASDQSRIDVQTVPDEVVISQVNQSVIDPGTFTSTAVDMRGYKTISFLGTSSNNSDVIKILYSVDDTTYYDSGNFLTQDFSSGDYSYTATLGIRYVKLTQASGDYAGNFTITCISSKK
jgi:hypothetical protein